MFYRLCVDRVHFWDFGGHPEYDEIRKELYHQTQVKVAWQGRKVLKCYDGKLPAQIRGKSKRQQEQYIR